MKCFLFRFTDGIITAAKAGGQQFVSIDGKKTYFDVGPTRMPPGYANGQPIQVKYFQNLKSDILKYIEVLCCYNFPKLLQDNIVLM